MYGACVLSGAGCCNCTGNRRSDDAPLTKANVPGRQDGRLGRRHPKDGTDIRGRGDARASSSCQIAIRKQMVFRWSSNRAWRSSSMSFGLAGGEARGGRSGNRLIRAKWSRGGRRHPHATLAVHRVTTHTVGALPPGRAGQNPQLARKYP